MSTNLQAPTSQAPPPNRIIAKQLAIVRRRLLAERVAVVFPWIATIAFAAAAVAIAVDKYYPLGLAWPIVLGIAAALAAIATLVAGAMTNRSELAAAVELDRRCKLDERVSTALALRPVALSSEGSKSEREIAARRAVEADAERAVAGVNVRASFPIVTSRRLAWPLVPITAAVVAALWLSPSVPPVSPAVAAAAKVQAQLKETAATLEKKIEETKTEAEKLKFVEAQKLLEKLQEEARKVKAATEVDQKETLVKLNDLAKQMEARREQVAGAEEMKKQLSRLRSKNPGTSEKLTNALSEGNFKAAAEQIAQLKKELESGKLDPKQKQEMGDQLERLQKQVEQLAQAQEERRKEAEQQLAAKQNQPPESKAGGDDKQSGSQKSGAKQDGKSEQASSKPGSQPGAMDESALAEQLSKMAAQQQSLDGLQQALDQATKGMQQGIGSDASQALDKLQKQLDQLSKQSAESRLLDRGLQDLAECKSCMGQGNDNGPEGMPGSSPGGRPGQNGNGKPGGGQSGQGGKNGQQLAGRGGNANGKSNEPGTGIGTGTGGGLDGEATGDDAAFDSRVKQQIGTGAFRIIGPTDGLNAKGKALEAIREQEQAVAGGREAQTLESQALDRSRREQKKQYFDALRNAD